MASQTWVRPWCLSAGELETWYNDSLQEGTGSFNAHCRMAVDKVVTSIHDICRSTFAVDRVIKSGSLGKGTVVKDLSDVDLVAFVNPPHLQPIIDVGPERYKVQLAEVLGGMARALGRLRNVTDIESEKSLVEFKLNNIGPHSKSVSIDLMATADCHLEDAAKKQRLFDAMLRQQPKDRLYYSPAVIENQLRFVKGQPTAVKALIRLVKYWSYNFLPDHLQKSYKLELITIHRWENAGSPGSFDKAHGLKDVLLTLSDLSQLRVLYWTDNYNATMAENVIARFRMQKPIVLDPSEPSDNVCSLYHKADNMQLMRSAAQSALGSSLLKSVHVRQRWN